MKADVSAGELRKTLRASMKGSHSSPRFIFGDEGLFILGHKEPAIKVEGAVVKKTGWGHLERDRAEKLLQALDILDEHAPVTIDYSNRFFKLKKFWF